MLEYIKGDIVELNPAYVIIDNTGLGYMVNISLNSFSDLEGKKSAKLFIHEAIREDAWSLYGFTSDAERQLFRLLIGVSGVGANTARMILSAMKLPELEQAIAQSDSKSLKAVKGVGAKTAERIIVDLKDKIKPTEISLISQPAVQSQDFDEALSALVMLGFQRQQSLKVLRKLFEDDPTLKVEKAIKKALSMM